MLCKIYAHAYVYGFVQEMTGRSVMPLPCDVTSLQHPGAAALSTLIGRADESRDAQASAPADIGPSLPRQSGPVMGNYYK